MKYPLSGHRCFKIPKNKLDLFLCALSTNFSGELMDCRAEYVFDAGEVYDVIVAKFGSYPYVERKMIEFVEEL